MAFGDTGVLDDFNRANEGPPMTGWADGLLTAGLVVSTNACAPSGAGNRASYYNTVLTAADCEVFATIASNPANNRNVSLFARLANIGSGTSDGYGIQFNKLSGTDTLQIFRLDNDSKTVLGADFSQELTAGNKFGLELVGDTLTAYVDTGSGWTSLGSRTDSTYSAAGYLGMDIGSGTMDDFGGGELAAGGTPIGLNTETDSTLALTAEKSKSTGLPTETDTPLSLAAQKAKAAGLNSETDTALALTRAKSRALGIVTETSAPLPVTLAGGTPIGLNSETDAPLGLTRAKSKAIGIVTETAVLLGLAGQKSRTLGLMTETNTPLSLTRFKTLAIGLVSETDTALAFAVVGGDSVVRYVTLEGEFETAVALEGEFETAVSLAGEFTPAVTLEGEL